MKAYRINGLPLVVGLLLVAGCSIKTSTFPDEDYGPDQPVDVSAIPDAVPRNAPRSRYGNPDSYTVLGKTYQVMKSARGYRERGLASWYGKKFHGRRTSSGETYDMYAMTAAHKTLPLPTWVRVTNLDNGRSVVVKVNDRGPFHRGRIIDISYAAAAKLGVTGRGTAPVEVVAITPGTDTASSARTGFPAFVQAGAFSVRANAERLQQRLRRDQGHPVKIENNGRHYRVIVGPLQNRTQLKTVAQLLEQWGIRQHHVVQ